MSAVSMKLIPASSARWMIRMLSSWSLLPQSPNIIAPRHSLLTETPVRPSGRCSIIAPSVVNGSRAAAATPARWGWSARLCCGTDEDLVERHAPRPGDGEHDDFRDVLGPDGDRKSTRLNSSHLVISYAVFCLKKKKGFAVWTSYLLCSTSDALP